MTPILRFDLPLAQGQAWLDLPCAAPAEGLAQARALAAALPVLAAVESWLGSDLPCPEPRQVPAVTERAASAPGLILPFDPVSALAGGEIVLPWAALKPGQPVPGGLPVRWPLWGAGVCLQQLPAARIAAGRLVPGAVLLLPAGFDGPWSVRVQALDLSAPTPAPSPPAGWQVAADWQPRQARLSMAGGPVATAAASADEPWSVWLSAPLRLDLRAWFGGCASDVSLSAGPAELRRGSQAVAAGCLLPCGAGWGLLIDRVESLELAAAWT